MYVLSLFITGETSKSVGAIKNLRKVIKEHSNVDFELRIFDILETPSIAVDRKIIATPTLIKEAPLPIIRIIGDLSDIDRVVKELNIDIEISSTKEVNM